MENKTLKATNMRGDEFQEAGRSLIGSEWRTRLAERFGVTGKTESDGGRGE